MTLNEVKLETTIDADISLSINASQDESVCGSIIQIPVDEIYVNDTKRIRELNPEMVKTLEIALSNGELLPMISVSQKQICEGVEKYKLIDGLKILKATINHAKKVSEQPMILARIAYIEDRAHEIRTEFVSNSRHGCQLTDRERTKYCEMWARAIPTDQLESYSGRALAREFGLSPTTGNKILSEILGVQDGHPTEQQSILATPIKIDQEKTIKNQSDDGLDSKDSHKPKSIKKSSRKDHQIPTVLLSESRGVDEVQNGILSLSLSPKRSTNSLLVCVIEHDDRQSKELEDRVRAAINKAVKVNFGRAKKSDKAMSASSEAH